MKLMTLSMRIANRTSTISSLLGWASVRLKIICKRPTTRVLPFLKRGKNPILQTQTSMIKTVPNILQHTTTKLKAKTCTVERTLVVTENTLLNKNG